jgi:hypothetical protein
VNFEGFYGNYCKKGERRAEAEVQLPQAQPVPALRKTARVSAQVWRVPLVFPVAGAQGRDPWRREVELVKEQLSVNSCQWSVAFEQADSRQKNFKNCSLCTVH